MKLYLIFPLVFIIFCSPGKESFGPHKWETKTFDFYINEEASLESEVVVRKTVQNWAEQTGFIFIYRGRNKAGLIKDKKNTISFMKSWPEGVSINYVGYTQEWYNSKGNIIEADIILNMQVSGFTSMKRKERGRFFIEGVLSHELGHFLGLSHIDEQNSIMKTKFEIQDSYFEGKVDESTLKEIQKLYIKNANP